jgi:hypothetical protein
MAQKFKCNICKKEKSDTTKWQCLRHKAICGDHVHRTIFGRKCDDCNGEVLRYEYNPKYNKYMKAK